MDITKLTEDFFARIDKVETFDEWDKRIIKLAFENALLNQELQTKNK